MLNALITLRNLRNSAKYRRTYGRWPDYVHPTLFSEKIQWRKIFDRNPLFPVFCDKLAVRDYVSDRAPQVRLPELLWTGSDPADIPKERLPDSYVVKPNHRSNCNYFVRSREGLTDVQVETMRKWVTTGQNRPYREWAYQSIAGRLLVEEMLATDSDPGMSRDYRFHVFHGRVHVIVVEFAEFAGDARTVLDNDAIYDRDWQRLPYRRVRTSLLPVATVPRPENLDALIAAAEALGEGVDYARVDLFLVHGEVYFGEITIYPGSGFNQYTLDDSEAAAASDGFDADMGRLWRLPELPATERLKTALVG